MSESHGRSGGGAGRRDSDSSDSGLIHNGRQATDASHGLLGLRGRDHHDAPHPDLEAASNNNNNQRRRPGEKRPKDGGGPTQIVAWRDLPKKSQLAVVTLARLSEPLAQTSLQAYMFYQLKWFNPDLPDSVISGQAGVLNASFTAAQFLTAMAWGAIADKPWAGRKFVILIGLAGTLISSLGFGFSKSFAMALFFRCLGGITNGNVGVMRTMINEMIQEKKYQSRAFLLLPMTFNIGVIIGPIMGGALADPAGTAFDPTKRADGLFGAYPYALPNLVSAGIVLASLIMTWLLLEETHDITKEKRDIGILFSKKVAALWRRFVTKRDGYRYSRLHSRNHSSSTASEISVDIDSERVSLESQDPEATAPPSRKNTARRFTQTLPYRRIFTTNVCLTLLAHFFLAFASGTFNSLWFVFLSTPVFDPANPGPGPDYSPQPPFRFTGGLGLKPQQVGLAMSVLGVMGIILQLFLYPPVSSRVGTIYSWRAGFCLFPLVFLILPYLSLLPSTTPPPSPKTGPIVWIGLSALLFIQVFGRTFALPAQTILVNNATPHPSVLGAVHGLGQSASSLARTIGPMLCGWLYGVGLSQGYIGAVFWGIALVAACGAFVSFWVREGNGHEIRLEGDMEDDQ